MRLVIKLLRSSYGPYLTAGVCVLIVGLTLAVGIEAMSLHRAEADLALARAGFVEQHKTLAICQADSRAFETALKAQNDAVAAGWTDGERRAARGVGSPRSDDAYRERAVALLAQPPAGNDTCSRVIDVDKRVLKGLE